MWTSVLAMLTAVISTQCVQIPRDRIPVHAKLNIQEMVQHVYYLYLVRTYSILKDEFIEKFNSFLKIKLCHDSTEQIYYAYSYFKLSPMYICTDDSLSLSPYKMN